MLRLTDRIAVADSEVEFRAVRARGPGGQHVNKTSSAIQLRFDIEKSSLPMVVKRALRGLRDRRIGADGVVVIKAQRFRSQEKNRADAVRRLAALVGRATAPVKRRIPVRPSRAAKTKRLEDKAHRSHVKARRKAALDDT